jgi:hypothetical protein
MADRPTDGVESLSIEEIIAILVAPYIEQPEISAAPWHNERMEHRGVRAIARIRQDQLGPGHSLFGDGSG